ncbi:hypothetical protein MBLNU459_g6376t3 [Dothideomycetes sp. NU459]
MTSSHLYFAATVACMTASLFGYSVGFIGGVLVLPSFLRHFDLLNLSPSEFASTQARVVLIWLTGAFLGVPLGIPTCQRLGRRTCLNLSAMLYVIGAGMQLINADVSAAKSLTLFEVARFISGLGVGAGTLVSPMYISEISPPETRGMLMSGYQTILQLSALIGFWGAFASHAIFPGSSNLQWQIPVAIQLAPGALLLLGTLLIPETPRFWAEQGEWQKVEISIAWLKGISTSDGRVNEEVDTIQKSIEITARAQYIHESFLKEITRKDIRNRLGVGVGLMIAQNMVGLNALNYYSPIIFRSAGFTSVSSSLFLTGIFGLVKLASALAFMFGCINIKGNRFWLKWGSGTCAVSMLVLAYLVHSFPPPDSTHEVKPTVGGAVSVLMVYIFTFAFGVSLGPISWNIFPLHINAKCCAITICTQWLFQGVVATLTPFLLAYSGSLTYLIYGGFCVLTLVWVVFCVPETRNVPLSRMDEVFGTPLEGVDTDELCDEASALLQNERTRKASFASLH